MHDCKITLFAAMDAAAEVVVDGYAVRGWNQNSLEDCRQLKLTNESYRYFSDQEIEVSDDGHALAVDRDNTDAVIEFKSAAAAPLTDRGVLPGSTPEKLSWKLPPGWTWSSLSKSHTNAARARLEMAGLKQCPKP